MRYEAPWYHHLHQLDPQLSDSSGGLLSSFGHILFILGFHDCDTHFYSHCRLAGSDSRPERWQPDQPTVPKVQMLSTCGGPKILLDQGSKYYVTDLTVASYPGV